MEDIIKLRKVVDDSKSLSEVCRKLGLINNGNTFKKLKKTFQQNDISTNHFIRKPHHVYDIKRLIKLVGVSTTFSEVCRGFGVKESGGNIKTIRKRIVENNIDISHFNGKGWNQGKRYVNNFKKQDLNEILVENSTYTNTHKLKLRLVDEGLLEYCCYAENCIVKNIWLNKKISLHLDHVNGNRKDNRIGNLRLLCPNCHSQTETYAGKNNVKK